MDINSDTLEKAQANITKITDEIEEKGVFKDGFTKDSILSKLSFSSKIEDTKDCDLVIEAIIENEKIKLDLFKKLDEVTKKDCVLASNTSSIPITRIASATNRPDKVIGMHL